MRFAVLVVIMMQAASSFAAGWPDLPTACLPSRAVPWDPTKDASQQAPCHCPNPATHPCPTDWRAWFPEQYPEVHTAIPNRNAADSINFVSRCCTRPTCESGTQLAGQPIPQDGNCDPVRQCPEGSILAGQPIPPDGNCNPSEPDPDPVCPEGSILAGQPIPPDGNCNPSESDPVCPEGTDLAGQQIPEDGNCDHPCGPDECDLHQLYRNWPNLTYCSGLCVPIGQDGFIAPARPNNAPDGDLIGGYTYRCERRNGILQMVTNGQIGGGAIGNCR